MILSKRLLKARAASGLTFTELAAWFGDTSRQSVWMWTLGREPQPYRMPQVEQALGWLEKELKRNKPRLPLPLGVRLGERLKHVREIRNTYS